ncbi:MAG: DUF2892 domain-containing protein [Acidimicrobiia bacterium]|jgi:hypothetical protein
MNPFVAFMVSPTGRVVRVVVGAAVIIWGWLGIGGWGGTVVALVGLVPLAAGLFDFCVFAPLFGHPMSGPKIRAAR